MKTLLRLFPVTLAALPTLAAAQDGVIPPNLAAAYGGGQARSFGGSNDFHGQVIYDQHRLPASLTPGSVITAVGIRTAERYPNQLACTLETAIWLYSTSTTSSMMSTNFASNVAGASGGLVFTRKPLNLPPINTETPAQGFRMVQLDTPHVFQGPNLCFEFEHYPPTISSGIFLDYCNVYRTGYGASFGTRCGSSRTNITNTATFAPGVRGTFGLWNGPANGAAWNLLSLRGNRVIDLTGIGGAGCKLYVGTEVGQPTPLSSAGRATVSISIPNAPFVEGLPLFTQWLYLDPMPTNALGIGATGARGMVIGGPTVCDGMKIVYRSGTNIAGPAPTAPILGLSY